ncbi:hypothetical protein H072_4785 [Dactylellina haptotyla CBS 200.50]|uniref:Uncharacterized protein n=1 Tax=Dactylellina haptotyla (strain CBS 200.50) TaxID=1284197 RepID=S8BP16_DACHA|nr:hypothetical protein H072_4785 [Dactylellina haptotyla CBS 200.50]
MSSPSIPTIQSLLQNPYLKNFITLLPFLFLGSLILFLLNRADTLRAGAGLQPPPSITPVPREPRVAQNPENDPTAAEDGADDIDGDEGYEDEEDVDINEFLAEAGGEINFNDDGEAIDNEAGPANAADGARRPPRNRGIVGKKKARNLEMRDRRRAYNEFLQSQARDRREREKALDEDLEEAIFSEKQRRALAEITIEKQKFREREEKREAEEKNAKYTQALRGCIADITGCGKVSLRTLGHRIGKDEAWVKKTVSDEKITFADNSKSTGVYTFITESGWLVRIGRDEIATVARRLEQSGKMDWEDLSDELESSLKRL